MDIHLSSSSPFHPTLMSMYPSCSHYNSSSVSPSTASMLVLFFNEVKKCLGNENNTMNTLISIHQQCRCKNKLLCIDKYLCDILTNQQSIYMMQYDTQEKRNENLNNLIMMISSSSTPAYSTKDSTYVNDLCNICIHVLPIVSMLDSNEWDCLTALFDKMISNSNTNHISISLSSTFSDTLSRAICYSIEYIHKLSFANDEQIRRSYLRTRSDHFIDHICDVLLNVGCWYMSVDCIVSLYDILACTMKLFPDGICNNSNNLSLKIWNAMNCGNINCSISKDITSIYQSRSRAMDVFLSVISEQYRDMCFSQAITYLSTSILSQHHQISMAIFYIKPFINDQSCQKMDARTSTALVDILVNSYKYLLLSDPSNQQNVAYVDNNWDDDDELSDENNITERSESECEMEGDCDELNDLSQNDRSKGSKRSRSSRISHTMKRQRRKEGTSTTLATNQGDVVNQTTTEVLNIIGNLLCIISRSSPYDLDDTGNIMGLLTLTNSKLTSPDSLERKQGVMLIKAASSFNPSSTSQNLAISEQIRFCIISLNPDIEPIASIRIECLRTIKYLLSNQDSFRKWILSSSIILGSLFDGLLNYCASITANTTEQELILIEACKCFELVCSHASVMDAMSIPRDSIISSVWSRWRSALDTVIVLGVEQNKYHIAQIGFKAMKSLLYASANDVEGLVHNSLHFICSSKLLLRCANNQELFKRIAMDFVSLIGYHLKRISLSNEGIEESQNEIIESSSFIVNLAKMITDCEFVTSCIRILNQCLKMIKSYPCDLLNRNDMLSVCDYFLKSCNFHNENFDSSDYDIISALLETLLPQMMNMNTAPAQLLVESLLIRTEMEIQLFNPLCINSTVNLLFCLGSIHKIVKFLDHASLTRAITIIESLSTKISGIEPPALKLNTINNLAQESLQILHECNQLSNSFQILQGKPQ